MKKVSIGILIGFLALIWTGSGLAGEAVTTNVLYDDGSRIVLDYAFGQFESRTVDIAGESYQEIWFPSEPVFLDEGAPALPHVNRSVIIPDDGGMSVRVLDADFYEIFARIVPSKGNLMRSVDPREVPYEFGDEYRMTAFYPGTVATLGRPYVMRDYRGIVVEVNPFQYNPVTGVLRIYTDVKLEITTDRPSGENALDRSNVASRPSKAFQTIYRSHFLNAETGGRYAPLDEEGDMLIIAHDPWIADLAPFVAHKNSVGISSSVVGVSTIGNNSTAIKNYIQGVYDAGNLAFVLLVGDVAEIATAMHQGGGYDPFYSKLAGGDHYPEIMVGRFSAGNFDQLETQLERTIEYETAPANTQDWFWKGTGIASAEGAGAGDEGQSDKQHMMEIRGWLMGAGYTEVDELYDPGASASSASAAFNTGRGVVNYTGHGWPQGWSTTGFDSGDVHALVNDNMLPFIVTVACNNGEFESYSECFAEAWMRATHNGEPTGAIAMYASSISQSWAPPMEGQDEFNLLLTDPDEPYFSFGALCFAGSSSMMDDYGGGGVDMFNTWIVFGDPSLRVRGSSDHRTGLGVIGPNLIAEGQAGGPFNNGTVVYTLENYDAGPLWYKVDLEPDVNWATIGNFAGIIPAEGTVQVTVTVNDAALNFDNGVYETALTFTNLTSHVGDTARPASLLVGLSAAQYESNFDVHPGWDNDLQWNFGQPSGQGGDEMGNPDPTTGATGDNVYGVNLHGDYAAMVGGPYHVTAGPFDLTGKMGTTLNFQRWLNIEGNPMTSASIEASVDGADWTTIWTNSDAIMDDHWLSQSYVVASVADRQDTVYFRWGYEVLDANATPCSGWNIDDVEVWARTDASARITINVGLTGLDWTPIEGAISYDAVHGDLGVLLSTDGDFTASTLGCVTDDRTETNAGFADDPLPGQGYWFLVRGVSESGPMSYQALYETQVGVRDEEINLAAGSCN